MKHFLFFLFICLFSKSVSAQRICTTPRYEAESGNANIARAAVTSNYASRDTVANEIITIPVVIHLLFNTAEQNINDAQILSQLAGLNKDFRRLNADTGNTPAAFRANAADTRVMFCLAQVDPNGRATRGIIRKHTAKEYFLGDDGMKFTAAGGDDAWDSKKYLNIWVCNMFGRSLGYSSLPGGPADKDGVVINYDVFGSVGTLRPPFDKGRTATHEIGHWLGLKHLWGDDNCGSDDVNDTPRQLGYNFNCPAFPHVTNCSENANGDMFMDFMDFTNDECMNMFTHGQKKKIRSLFSITGSRNSILSSFTCDSSFASGAPLPDDTIPVAKPLAGVNVFPNPVQQMLNINSIHEYVLTGKTCSIYSAAGVRLMRQTMKSEKEILNLISLRAGIYILKIGEGADTKTIRIVKV